MTRRNENIIYPPGLKKEVWLILIFCCFTSALWGAISLDIPKTLLPPKIDGILNDEVWKNAKGYSDFISFFPDYGKLCEEKTLVYSAYDADNLFFAFKCYDRSPGKIIATVGKRDTIGGEDLVAIYIDSHNDGQNAYTFIINPLGIQQDGISDSNDEADFSSDLVWESAGVLDKEGYTIEVKIPFTTLRFSQAKIVKMKIGFLRKISRYTEQYAFPEWKPGGAMITQLGLGQFEGIKYKRVIELLPAATYMKRREKEASNQFLATADKNLGLTAKIGLTSDLILDITYNPDFSHIEMDEGQVDVNLRVDPLYEEKRPFFQEGLEHFKFAGSGENKPIEKIVNTREIIEPIWGLKLSGKIGSSGIINSLFTVDESPTYLDDLIPEEERGENSYFGIFRYKYLFKGDSYVGGIYTGKKFKNGYHHVGGVDSKIRFSRFITAEAFFLHSLSKPSDSVDLLNGSAWTGNLKYENRKYNVSLGYQDLTKKFNLEVGRMIRYGVRVFSADVERYIFLKSDFLKLITLGYSGSLTRDKDSEMNEYFHEFYVELRLPSFTGLRVGYDFATEVFGKKLFEKDGFYIDFDSRVFKQLQLSFFYSSGESPLYEKLLQGNTNFLFCSLNFKPGNKFSNEFTVKREIFHQDEGNSNDYDYKIGIYRNKTTFHLNKYLFLRGIIEYNDYYKRMLLDCLVGFLQIPGPGIYLGYGSTLERGFEDMGVYRYDRLKETRSGLFFKASYLFRF